jgi:hypothetical protein
VFVERDGLGEEREEIVSTAGRDANAEVEGDGGRVDVERCGQGELQ